MTLSRPRFAARKPDIPLSYLDNERTGEQRRRWTRENAHLYIRPDAELFMRHDAHRFLTLEAKGWRHPDGKLFDPFFRYRKAGFDPAQPRVPAGNPDGGQWTDSGSSGGNPGGGINDRRVISDATPDNEWKPGARYAANETGSEPLPKIPKQRPPNARLRNRVIKETARWLVKVGARELTGPVGIALNIAEAGSWFYQEAYPYLRAYIDAPKTLDELQDALRTPGKGYDIHHIVEQTSARQDGFSRVRIDASDNLVRVPTLKHWQITGWYMMRNEEYGGLSPREYLRGKSWEERRAVGLRGLIEHGVLKP